MSLVKEVGEAICAASFTVKKNFCISNKLQGILMVYWSKAHTLRKGISMTLQIKHNVGFGLEASASLLQALAGPFLFI